MLMCRDLAKQASDYVDGELGVSRRLSIRMHLLMCRHCRNFVTRLGQSAMLIQAHSHARTDPAFISQVNAEVERALAAKTQLDPGH